ncbi:MAG: hypothetical protein JRI25_15545 [Deltaproteobacteria bacterium]|nr:hypothetical protein [Deltaproteobacteria bacterium]MBW2255997.1 hypothetical protein [Deltaproteobacteria bacterium]
MAEYLARVKHDLGKYICFQVRWLAPDASVQERRAALVADLTATRRGPGGSRDAASLWAALRPALVGEASLPGGATVDLSSDPLVQMIDEAIAVIAEVVPALGVDPVDEAAVGRAERAARKVSEACQDLVRRYRRRRA